MYTGSYTQLNCTHSRSQPLLHGSRVPDAVVVAVVPFTFVPAESTSCIKRKNKIPSQWEIAKGTSPPLHITEQ